jgi:serine/threonine-protein kinase
MAMRVILEVIESENASLIGQQFVFDQHQAFVVGRKKNERVQFRIPEDPYFSRYHMMIEVNPPDCYVRDLGSRNGTKVNGRKVREARLKDGDKIGGGHTKMRLRIEAESPVASCSVAPPPPAEPAAAPPSRPNLESTTLFGLRPNVGGNREVVCAVCSAKAEDAQLLDLTQTRLLAYVCPTCTAQRQDNEHPIPNYRKIRKLSDGVLGPVYQARRVSSDKLVALKMLAPALHCNDSAVRTFLREMLLTARLDHPRIVPVVEIGKAGKDLWLASQWIEGVDARQWSQNHGGRVPVADAVEIVCQVLEALQYAHDSNLVHRDVKPANILVIESAGRYDARLTDFGLLRNTDEAGVTGITMEGEVRGSVPFMPPEQVMDCRFVKPAGDLYAAAATLYWLLTNEYIHDFEARDARGDVMDPYLIILDSPIIPLRQRDPSIPEPVARVVEQALASDPEDRYATAAEMSRELRSAAGLERR